MNVLIRPSTRFLFFVVAPARWVSSNPICQLNAVLAAMQPHSSLGSLEKVHIGKLAHLLDVAGLDDLFVVEQNPRSGRTVGLGLANERDVVTVLWLAWGTGFARAFS
jgi:hypothetical protein